MLGPCSDAYPACAHVRVSFSYLGNGRTDCAEIWYVVRDQLAWQFAQTKGIRVHLHLHTCIVLFRISGTAGSIVLKFVMLVKAMLCVLYKSWIGWQYLHESNLEVHGSVLLKCGRPYCCIVNGSNNENCMSSSATAHLFAYICSLPLVHRPKESYGYTCRLKPVLKNNIHCKTDHVFQITATHGAKVSCVIST